MIVAQGGEANHPLAQIESVSLSTCDRPGRNRPYVSKKRFSLFPGILFSEPLKIE